MVNSLVFPCYIREGDVNNYLKEQDPKFNTLK